MNKVDERVCHGFIALNLAVAGNSTEDLAELLVADLANKYLGLNSAQECSVQKLRGIKIRSKHDQHFKRHFDLPSARQGEEVDLAVERNHPPVQQFIGPNSLAPEIIDDQHAIVGLHLHGARVEL